MQATASSVQWVPLPSVRVAANSEIDIIEQASHHPAAFGVLYDLHFERIYRYVSSRVPERRLAEDITQEVFLNALKSMPTYRDKGACFSAWLYRIASNAIASHYRRAKHEVDLDTAVDLADRTTEGVLDEVVRRDRSRRIWQAIDRLPRQQRVAMRLKFTADLSTEDVARAMGKSRGAIKLLIYRAVQRLRRELGPVEGYDAYDAE